MAKNKRNTVQKERDLALISKLNDAGLTQQQIAFRLKELTGAEYLLTQQQISLDLETLKKRWRRESLESTQELIERELRSIDHTHEQALIAWQKSTTDIKQVFTKRSGKLKKKNSNDTNSSGGIDTDSLEQTEKTIVMTGNPMYLSIILECSRERRKLLGLDAPVKNLNIGLNPYENMSDAELKKYLEDNGIKL